MEMLVVMAIAAVMGTLTVVSFAAVGRRGAREGAAQDVSGVLRQARLSAVDSGLGAVVRINPADRTIYGLSRKVEAAWHLEDMYDTDPGPGEIWETRGARSMHGRPVDADGDPNDAPPTVVPGTVGLCFRFNYDALAVPPAFDPSLQQYVDCGQYPIYDQTDGIRLEAAVRPEGASFGDLLGVIAKTDGVDGYALWLECDDATGAGTFILHAQVAIEGLGLLPLDSDTVTLPGSRWSHVAFEYDGFEARLLLNGILVDLDSYRDVEDAPVWPHLPNPMADPNPATDVWFGPQPPDPPDDVRMVPARRAILEIGARNGADYFQGRIDEPQILSVAGGRRVTLPEGVPIVTSDEAIYFDGQGYLDMAHHTVGAYIAVGDPYQSAEAVSIGPPIPDPLNLRVKNPFPAGGGLVMLQDQIIDYAGASGLQLSGLTIVGGYGGAEDDVVRFARVVRIGPTGIVERAERAYIP